MTAYAAPSNVYRQSAVLTATPGQLVVMLYDGAHRFLVQAATAMRDDQMTLSGEKLRRAEAIIDELLATLDLSAGEIAVRLQALYAFFKDHLAAGRLEKDPAKIEEVAGFMSELRDSWAEIAAA